MVRSRGLSLPAVAITGALALLTATVLAGAGHAKPAAAAVIAVAVAIWIPRWAASWPRLLAALLLVVMLIPIDRYTVAGASLPFELEPYRLLLALLIAGWLASLLVDDRVQLRKTGFELPLGLIVFATLGSEAANPQRVGSLSSYVLKAIWFFLFFVILVYFGVSVIRTRAAVERLASLLVGAGCVVAIGAVVQRRVGYDVFDHVRTLLPVLSFHPVATDTRNGYVRAVASAGHPIELAVVMTMLAPLAIYLWMTRRQSVWIAAVALLMTGMLATGARTAVVGIVAVLAVLLWLRRRETLSLWPLLIPAVILVQVADPGALGGLRAALFPAGGIIAEQQHQVRHSKVVYGNRIADWGPSLTEFSHHNPLFGEGYGTRITGFGVKNNNAAILDDQWLKTLLETGFLGIVGWLWLFIRTIRRLGARAKLEADTREGWLPVALAGSTAVFAVSMGTYDAFSFFQGTFLLFTLLFFAAVTLALPPVSSEPAELQLS